MAGRPPAWIIVALPVVVWDDAEQTWQVADQVFSRYAALPGYRRQFDREGIATPGEIPGRGSESAVEQQLRAYAAIGATEFWPIAFPAGRPPKARWVGLEAFSPR